MYEELGIIFFGSVAFVMLVRGDTNQKKAVQGSCPHEPYKHTFFYGITFGILPIF
jgi:hypothetical protein